MPRWNATKIKLADISEIVVGACVLGFPVAVTGEVWDLSAQLPWSSVIPTAAWSVFFLGAFVRFLHFKDGLDGRVIPFAARVMISYALTLVCCAAILALVDKLDPLAQPAIALKRTILVGFPASFAATVVDAMGPTDASPSDRTG